MMYTYYFVNLHHRISRCYLMWTFKQDTPVNISTIFIVIFINIFHVKRTIGQNASIHIISICTQWEREKYPVYHGFVTEYYDVKFSLIEIVNNYQHIHQTDITANHAYMWTPYWISIALVFYCCFRWFISIFIHLLIYGTSKSPRHLVADTRTESRGIESWEVTVFIQKWWVVYAIYLLKNTTHLCCFIVSE